jgi:tRNA pseudouridine38-40 synthase
MFTWKVTLAYDGTGYVGWQRQASGTSIQGLLEHALEELDGRHVPVSGAGRTDAGVHALGQVAAFALERDIDGPTLVRALNARLPADVRALDAVEVAPGFHARLSASAKIYRYRLWNAGVLSPFERAYTWHIPSPTLDVPAMRTAATLLEGRHDFRSFQSTGSAVRSTERVVFSMAVRHREPLITCDIRGDGFLRHMVRTIVGTIVEVGRGKHRPAWVREVLASRQRATAGPTAPAEGLFLVSVEYNAQL